ncbi:50S ribosomal protein L31 [Patescibacteria group bacterium]|nr:50S ribosomal protein L31 [Patescibacteria group bacterium]
MKAKIHPKYHQITITCACGNVINTGSTTEDIQVEICSKCHPFYTGEMRYIDTLGRVDKFLAKRKAAGKYQKKQKTKSDDQKPAKSLKDMLTVTPVSK